MHWQNCRNCFEFDHHKSANEEIYPVAILNHQVLVSDWDRDLALNTYVFLSKFIDQVRFVSTFQQSGADSRMDLHCGANHCMTDIFLGHLCVLRVSIASFALPSPR